MDVTRMSIARVLELGVAISWQEAAAVVFEGVSKAHELEGSDRGRVAPATCLITRGGEVVLGDDAGRAHPEALAELAVDLLAACDDRGDLGAAVDAGRLLPFLETLSVDTTWKRRRVQIAAVALRALAAEADRVLADAGDAAAPELAVKGSANDEVRQFTRQNPRPSRSPLEVQGSAQHDHRPAHSTPSRTALVSARVIVWAAVAASATGAGLGLWQARSRQVPPPTMTGPAAESRNEAAAGAYQAVAPPVAAPHAPDAAAAPRRH